MSIISHLAKVLDSRGVFDEISLSRSKSVYLKEPGFAFLVARYARARNDSQRVIVVVPSMADAEVLARDLEPFQDEFFAAIMPSWDTLPFERLSPRLETMAMRLRCLWELTHRESAISKTAIWIVPARSLAQKIDLSSLGFTPIEVNVGSTIDMAELVRSLGEFGYRREYQVESLGEFAVRGSIVDLFAPGLPSPIRIDFFGDEIDRLSNFSLVDQLSTEALAKATIFPIREFRPNASQRGEALTLADSMGVLSGIFEQISQGIYFEGMESWTPFFSSFDTAFESLLTKGDTVIVSDSPRVVERISAIASEEEDLILVLGPTWGLKSDEYSSVTLYVRADNLFGDFGGEVIFRDSLARSSDSTVIDIGGVGLGDHRSETIVSAIRSDMTAGFCVLVSADSAAMANRIIASLKDEGVGAFAIRNTNELEVALSNRRRGGVGCFISGIEVGFRSARGGFVVIGPSDFTGHRVRRTSTYSTRSARGVGAFFDSLSAGGYVVHDYHGVGRYLGMVRRSISGVERDYLEIEYRDKAKLFVPTDQMGALTPYSGGDNPTLSRMGGTDWTKTKAKVKASVERIAQELVLLYQKRLAAVGFSHAPDTNWQVEMEELFPYTLTPDQQKAIVEVKADMESDRPMDRLICGDVGFGKTEVAIRAAFKAVQAGKQVAILVPTTLLAQQHYQTFSERFSPFPVRVEVVSRFLSNSEAKEIIASLGDRSVDVIIGTHRLLSKDVKFGDLGLLIVDEEQRFGVTHKEAIKALSVNVDVLTLSATPIPRTLEMSLTGLRDLSLLNTPPGSRQPILTYVGDFDEAAVTEAIRRELLREGQVFYVHNRVMDIEAVASRIRMLVPEARVAVAHGQMEESHLETIVEDFWRGEFDVLVCTTIIESGIDMPTVNTLVVDRAELLGLGQLHQLRGRVGRAGVKAYAYLFHAPNTKLTEEAYERLKTIGEAIELGSGFRIAMRDLEIRGAGSLLGHTQSGHIAAVGYDLYVKMVKEAIAYLNGEEVALPVECRIDIPVSATIPRSYIEKDEIRLETYKELADCQNDEAISAIQLAWQDRFGPVPDEAKALCDVTRIRNRALYLAMTEVKGVIQSTSFQSRLRITMVGFSPALSALVNLRRRFAKADFRDISKTLSIEVDSTLDPVEVILSIMDLLIERANIKSARIG